MQVTKLIVRLPLFKINISIIDPNEFNLESRILGKLSGHTVYWLNLANLVAIAWLTLLIITLSPPWTSERCLE